MHHDQLLKGIDSLDAVGCFALTELGYGKQLNRLLSRQVMVTTSIMTCVLTIVISKHACERT